MNALIKYQLQNYGGQPIVKVKINNRVCNFLLDTGAGVTCIDEKKYFEIIGRPQKFESIELTQGFGGMVELKTIKVAKIEIANIIIKDSILSLMDLENINSGIIKLGGKKIDGILGTDILISKRVEINFYKEHGSITFHKL